MPIHRTILVALLTVASLLSTQTAIGARTPDSQSQSPDTSERSALSRLSGTVVDTSGAVISGATVHVQSKNGSLQKSAQTDKSGIFMIPGLPAGNYQLVVSSADFETREMSISVGNPGAMTPIRISLAVHTVSTTVNVQGRADDLIGIADSGTQGTVGAVELQDRPILRSGEVLEAVPGLIITQHAGGGKANQYYLRGFSLDHGTDLAIFIDDMPLNLPSHAHGEGYSDMNIVIPEFVKRVNFEKGPYYANIGNFGSTGAAHVEYFKTLPKNFFQVEGGTYDYGRAVFGASHKLGEGNLLYGGELYYDNGPWTHPDAFTKLNGLLTYSQGDDANGLGITARGYHGRWHSSDQIPVSAVSLVGLYGTLDPSDGGHSQRYSLQPEWHRQNANSVTRISTYLFYYDLDLFSNFTYYLVDPVHGDQFEQQDRRWVTGFEAHHTVFSQWAGRKMENTIGLQLRNDWINNGLYAAKNRVRMQKTDYNTDDGIPVTLPATRERDRFTDTIGSFYAENKMQWMSKFRSAVALRGDDEKFIVHSLAYSATVNAANSGSATKFLPSPKASLVFGPWANTEFYAQGGFSFHSNDGRGTTQTVEPISADDPYPNTPAPKTPPLVQTKGGEIGVRTVAVPHLQSTVSLWYLHSNSELMQDGDTGGTSASEQPSNRYGFEWANYYTPWEHLAIDFDIANSRALFTQVDGDDAAPNSDGGKHVPEAVGLVIASGVTLHDWNGFSSSMRLRYFGPRDLTSDGIFRSKQTVLLNGELGYKFGKKWHASAEFLNMLDRADSDIDYAYESRVLPGLTSIGIPAHASTFTRVAHPVEPFQIRFGLTRHF
ncbi:TonB-dependent receptor [Telmatobacter bradus]|uniref:TonB-dependent receptor n=1 Tax=Telmatobacter bradus TaxID=474953 RepID=UPI003B429E1C